MSLRKIKLQRPLVHCITNNVVVNFTANGLLAIGASPVMADAVEEVEEMTSKADALLLNIGTLNEQLIQAMILAGHSANKNNVPVVLDPVGVGATKFRLQTTRNILKEIRVNLIRCNVGELAAIAGIPWEAKGVDSGKGEIDVAKSAMKVAREYNCFVIVTGKQDVITDGTILEQVKGGHEKVTQITGSGCLLSAFCAAELASSTNIFEDLTNLLREYKKASLNANATIGTFHVNFLNQLENLAGEK